MASGPPSVSGGSAPSHSQTTQQTETDPLAKYQTLLPILKESVTNLIRDAVIILQNTVGGQCKQGEIQSLNKDIEDFYNISDQIQQWLILADSIVRQNLLGKEFSINVTPTVTNSNSADANQGPPKEVLFYTQFLKNAKKHVAAAKKLDDLLADFADGIGTDSRT